MRPLAPVSKGDGGDKGPVVAVVLLPTGLGGHRETGVRFTDIGQSVERPRTRALAPQKILFPMAQGFGIRMLRRVLRRVHLSPIVKV